MIKVLSFIIVVLFGFSTPSIAEPTDMPAHQQGSPEQSIDHPPRGITKAQVSKRFGAPTQQRPPVGEPPISQWVYSNFTVYFEDNHVIHSVTHP